MSPVARLLFIAMWNWADDAGRGTYFPRELMGFAFPNDEDMSVADFRGIVAEIRAHCAVEFYDVAGRHYFEIPSWKKHQSRHAKLSASKYPGPEDGDPIDPESLQVIGSVPESRRNSGDSRRNSGAPNRESVLGTGEQGNRGTGEQSKNTCSSNDEPGSEPADEPTSEPNPYPQVFEDWWNLYPRKQAKRKALNEWRRATKRINREELNQRTQAFATFHENEGTDRQFIPLPTTWLTRDGWEDELIPRHLANQQTQHPTNSLDAWLPPTQSQVVDGEIVEQHDWTSKGELPW
ncbi:hypothetical protein [Corynebacterium striatum]|uniref:hypothetical protein n=1 Tax=Corynebacterium striatum TaxID=43770 RepID=UPI00128C15F8|nr:hypothetical protein [Corynebacterium striatum]